MGHVELNFQKSAGLKAAKGPRIQLLTETRNGQDCVYVPSQELAPTSEGCAGTAYRCAHARRVSRHNGQGGNVRPSPTSPLELLGGLVSNKVERRKMCCASETMLLEVRLS